MTDWFDKNGVKIKAGDFLQNSWNNPPIVPVLTDGKKLYLEDMDTPFHKKFRFDEFWEVTNDRVQ